jgi:hypothetical protein
MDGDSSQPVMAPLTRYGRWRRTRVHRLFVRWIVWRGTERVASATCRLIRWWDGPIGPRGRFRNGLHTMCWTHVCGHGLRYAFDTGCIWWFPRYAKKRLRLP